MKTELDTVNDPRIERLKRMHRNNQRVRKFDARKILLLNLNFDGLRGEGILLTDAVLFNSSFRSSRMQDCDFQGADFRGTDFYQAMLRNCNMEGIKAPCARFVSASLEDNSLVGSDFSRANLRFAKLTESSWTRASLQNADLTGARGDGLAFRGVDMQSCHMTDVKFREADFRGADLTGADLSNGDFYGADFRGAILEDVRWTNAVIRGAMFDSTSLRKQIALQTGTAGNGQSEDFTGVAVEGQNSTANVDDVADAFSKLISRALHTSVNGSVHIDREMRKLKTEWRAWNAKIGHASVENMSELMKSLEKSLDDSGTLPSQELSMLTNVLSALHTADDVEPSEEWKTLLSKLFPELTSKGEPMGLDRIASTLTEIFHKK